MEGHEQQARKLFLEGYNCAQSVYAAFCDVLGVDFEEALKLSSSFGGGMGRMREVCGAVSSMLLIAGALYGYSEPDDEAKGKHYQLVQSLAGKFREENGSIICRELLGSEGEDNSPIPRKRTQQYYAERPCERLVASAARIIDQLINMHKNEYFIVK